MRTTFAVGRSGARSRTVVWLRRHREPRPPFPGPWKVRALVTGSLPPEEPGAPSAPPPSGDVREKAADPEKPSGTVEVSGSSGRAGQLDLFGA